MAHGSVLTVTPSQEKEMKYLKVLVWVPGFFWIYPWKQKTITEDGLVTLHGMYTGIQVAMIASLVVIYSKYF